MGLVKMYRVTGNPKYLEKAKYFCEEAGRFSDGRPASPYSQDHKPIKEQDEAVGHAVRFGYLYSGVADVAPCARIKDSSKLQNGYGTISPTGNYISQEVSEPEPGEKDSGKITNFRT